MITIDKTLESKTWTMEEHIRQKGNHDSRKKIIPITYRSSVQTVKNSLKLWNSAKTHKIQTLNSKTQTKVLLSKNSITTRTSQK